MSSKEEVIKTLKDGLSTGEKLFAEYLFNMSGGFYDEFFSAAMIADNKNLEKLAKGYPEEIEALRRYKNEDGYWRNLQLRYRKALNDKRRNN